MEIVVERCAGLDVHKDLVVACVRAPGPGGERETKIASFSTFTDELLALRDWLVSLGVTRVGMEATGVYWKPVVRHEALFDRAEMKGLRLQAVAAAC
jgi:transposase